MWNLSFRRMLPQRISKHVASSIASMSMLIPVNRLTLLLQTRSYGDIVDVGSNRGNWSNAIIPKLKIDSSALIMLIDPIQECSEDNLKNLQKLAEVQCVRLAVGSGKSFGNIHIASNDGESSSFLNFAAAHSNAAPEVVYLAEEKVEIAALDFICHDILGRQNTLLKIDVQGFEMEVLQGASRLLNQCSVIVVEASLRETYQHGSTLFTVSEKLHSRGFYLGGLVESFSEKNYGEMIQMDAVFFRI
jgi:FkbM family methyltransferase